jgi:hypothetical protein
VKPSFLAILFNADATRDGFGRSNRSLDNVCRETHQARPITREASQYNVVVSGLSQTSMDSADQGDRG